MAARPRLVHEGSPIIEDGGSCFPPSVATTSTMSNANGVRENANAGNVNSRLATIAGATKKASTASKPYKLQTTLVVGGDLDEDDDLELDTMMMDEDDHDHGHDLHNQHQNGISNGGSDGHAHAHHTSHQQQHHESNTSDHGIHGGHAHQHQHHTFYQHHTQQHRVEHVAYPTSLHQHLPSEINQFHNIGHNVLPTDPIQHAPMTYPPPHVHNTLPPCTSPLVVLDAANIAYNYAETLRPTQGNQRRQPDPRGIRIAIEYFLKHNCRVQAVVPISWYQLKPRPGDHYHLQNRSRGDSDAKMVTEEVEELRNLRQQGFLVACPPGDDDDAYALALARREEDRLSEQRGMQHQDDSMGMMDDDAAKQHLPASVLGGYVVSNDFFQDAIRRDDRRHEHQQQPLHMRPMSLKSWLKNNRISYSFANVGMPSEYGGEIQLEFLPNPRNDLIEAIDDICNRLNRRPR